NLCRIIAEIVSKMRKTNHQITFFLFSEETRIMLGDFNRIQIFRFAITLFAYETGEFNAEAENPDTDAVFIKDFVRHSLSFKNGIFEIVIRAYKRKLSIWQSFLKTFETIIELVVSHGRGFITHH